MLHARPLQGYFELSLHNATLHVSSATINDEMYSELLVYLGSQLNDDRFTAETTRFSWETPSLSVLASLAIADVSLSTKTLL